MQRYSEQMTPRRGAAQLTEEHPLLRLGLSASEARLMANLLLRHLETESGRSASLEALAQQLLIRAALTERGTPQA